MKKKSLYARCEVARTMVQDRRAFAPRVVQSKKRVSRGGLTSKPSFSDGKTAYLSRWAVFDMPPPLKHGDSRVIAQSAFCCRGSFLCVLWLFFLSFVCTEAII